MTLCKTLFNLGAAICLLAVCVPVAAASAMFLVSVVF